MPDPSQNNDTRLKIHHIDIGQGDATLIVLKKGDHTNRTTDNILKAVLIDSGNTIPLGNRIVEYLKQVLRLNVDGEYKTLDAILCSHYDDDHIGGFGAIIPSEFCDENTKIYDRGLISAQSLMDYPKKGNANNNGAAKDIYGYNQKDNRRGGTIDDATKSLLLEKRKKLNWKLFCNSDIYTTETQNNLIILGGLDTAIDDMEIGTFSNKLKKLVNDSIKPTELLMIEELEKINKSITTAVKKSLDFIFLNIKSSDDVLLAAITAKVEAAKQIGSDSLLYPSGANQKQKAEELQTSIKTLRDKIQTCFQRMSVDLEITATPNHDPTQSPTIKYTEKKLTSDNTLVGTKVINFTSANNTNLTLTCIAANGYILNNKNTQIADPKANPPSGDIHNQMGLAFLLTYGNFYYYTAGDIGQIQEIEIANYLQDTIKKQLNAFKVSHHGSENSTPDQLLNQLTSTCIAFISYGWDNSFLHPRFSVIKKLTQKVKDEENPPKKIIIYFSSLLAKIVDYLKSPSKKSSKKTREQYKIFKDITEILNLTAFDNKIHESKGQIGVNSQGGSRTAAPGTLLLTVTENEAKKETPQLPKLQVSYDRMFTKSFDDVQAAGNTSVDKFIYSLKLLSELFWIATQNRKQDQTKAKPSTKRNANEMAGELSKQLKAQKITRLDSSLDTAMLAEAEKDPNSASQKKLISFCEDSLHLDNEVAKTFVNDCLWPTLISILPISQEIKRPRYTWPDKTQHITKITDTITPS